MNIKELSLYVIQEIQNIINESSNEKTLEILSDIFTDSNMLGNPNVFIDGNLQNSINNINYLASGRYDEDFIQYFYTSNYVYASSNFTKNIKLKNV